MPQPKVRYDYNFAKNDIIVGGVRLSRFGEDGGVEYEFGADERSSTASADGFVTVSEENDPRMTATITVMEGGRADQELARLRRQQQDTYPISPLSFYHRDPGNGDLVKSSQAVFMTRPSPNKSRQASERTYQILLPYAADTYKPAGQ